MEIHKYKITWHAIVWTLYLNISIHSVCILYLFNGSKYVGIIIKAAGALTK